MYKTYEATKKKPEKEGLRGLFVSLVLLCVHILTAKLLYYCEVLPVLVLSFSFFHSTLSF